MPAPGSRFIVGPGFAGTSQTSWFCAVMGNSTPIYAPPKSQMAVAICGIAFAPAPVAAESPGQSPRRHRGRAPQTCSSATHSKHQAPRRPGRWKDRRGCSRPIPRSTRESSNPAPSVPAPAHSPSTPAPRAQWRQSCSSPVVVQHHAPVGNPVGVIHRRRRLRSCGLIRCLQITAQSQRARVMPLRALAEFHFCVTHHRRSNSGT